jgi:hypothetical protein
VRKLCRHLSCACLLSARQMLLEHQVTYCRPRVVQWGFMAEDATMLPNYLERLGCRAKNSKALLCLRILSAGSSLRNPCAHAVLRLARKVMEPVLAASCCGHSKCHGHRTRGVSIVHPKCLELQECQAADCRLGHFFLIEDSWRHLPAHMQEKG